MNLTNSKHSQRFALETEGHSYSISSYHSCIETMQSFSLSTCHQIHSRPNPQKLEQQQGQLTVAQQQEKAMPGSDSFAA
jgi:hypothetical protein